MDDRVRKIQALIDHGATEGEREAAREAMRRLEASGKDITSEEQTELVHIFARMGVKDPEMYIRIFFNDSEMNVQQSTKPSHHGRVWWETA